MNVFIIQGNKYFREIIIFFAFLMCSFCGFVFAVDIPGNTIVLEGSPYGSILVGTSNLYVISKEKNAIYVVNTSNGKVSSTKKIDQGPTRAIIFNDKIYIANSDDNAISVFYTSGTYKTKTIVGPGPIGLIGIGTKVYVVCFDDTVQIIDSGNSLIKEVKIPMGNMGPNLTNIGNKIFLHHSNGNSISVFDAGSSKVVSSIYVGKKPQMSIVKDKKLYVLNAGSNDVSVVNTDTYAISKTISAGESPMYGMIVGNKLYVLNATGNSMSIIDTTSDTVTKTVTVGKNPSFLVNHGDFLYVLNAGDNSVSFFDKKGETVTKTVPVGRTPQTATLVGAKIYVNNTQDAFLTLIDTATVSLTKITSSTANGTYKTGDTVQIEAIFDQYLSSESTMTVELDTGREVVLSTVNGKSLVGDYVIQEGNSSNDLTVKSIKASAIVSLSGHDKKTFSVPTSNLGTNKNIKIIGSPLPTQEENVPPTVTVDPVDPEVPRAEEEDIPPEDSIPPPPDIDISVQDTTCQYRSCQGTATNVTEYRDNLVCEGFMSAEQAQSRRRTITRGEVLMIAVHMLGGAQSSPAGYANTFSDITRDNKLASYIQTGLDFGLLYPVSETFEPGKNITRIEAYALLMKGVCMIPNEQTISAFYEMAYQEALTKRSWRTFVPLGIVTRSEVYALAYKLALWAEESGGCNLECRQQ